MGKRVKLTVGDHQIDAEEKNFNVVHEEWNEYMLEDGTVVKVKTTPVKMFRVLDDQGKPSFTPDGEPSVLVKHQTIAVAS